MSISRRPRRKRTFTFCRWSTRCYYVKCCLLPYPTGLLPTLRKSIPHNSILRYDKSSRNIFIAVEDANLSLVLRLSILYEWLAEKDTYIFSGLTWCLLDLILDGFAKSGIQEAVNEFDKETRLSYACSDETSRNEKWRSSRHLKQASLGDHANEWHDPGTCARTEVWTSQCITSCATLPYLHSNL